MLFVFYPLSLFLTYLASNIDHAFRNRSKNLHASCLNIGVGSNRAIFGMLSALCVVLWSLCAVALFYIAGVLPDPDNPFTATQVSFHTWIVSLLNESIWIIAYFSVRDSDITLSPISKWEIIEIVLGSSRIAILSGLVWIYWRISKWRYNDQRESRALLGPSSITHAENGVTSHYGSTSGSTGGISGRDGDAQTTTWLDYLVGFRKILPFLWPSDSSRLQVRAIFCIFLLILQRVVNIVTPHQLGVVVRSLGPGKLLHRLSAAAFDYVLWLSLDFHLSNRLGKVASALSKGNAFNTFLDTIYFFFMLDASYAFIVLSVIRFYFYLTIYMAKYRGQVRRKMATRERAMEAAKTDALLSYETVYYCGAVPGFQNAEYRVLFSLNLLNVTQNNILTVASLLICYLDAYHISMRRQDVSMFNNLINAERMLELFKKLPGVTGRKGAIDLDTYAGKISFKGVSFAYNGSRNQALKDVSFDVEPGTSVAIVGESGSGKSTVLKLLFRFYDVDHSSIEVDSRDIRNLRLQSLRDFITILFNNTLMYNLRYLAPNANDEMVYEACRAANIHNKILNFPNGYATVVGERGLKISSGERQRGRTTLTIAHRLSTIKNADKIVVLSGGHVVESGKHGDLLTHGGAYARMWSKQNEKKVD
ncbi:heavy metal tolerance protein [Xylaria bambusicola]|uniref:heavy metal tolerance protein n=1 Tax=Xylaria bambusicola TaxID=326684 RepID=UPI002008485F|nr:heavy metal tolerance protein [Xylaria bambusicola]KAI0508619.1 heavy metal tolerance protein [Xylaria bambusicola]